MAVHYPLGYKSESGMAQFVVLLAFETNGEMKGRTNSGVLPMRRLAVPGTFVLRLAETLKFIVSGENPFGPFSILQIPLNSLAETGLEVLLWCPA